MKKRAGKRRERMFSGTDEEYRIVAKALFHDGGVIEIDDNAVVSRGGSNGAYVQAWVWVEKPST